MAEKLFSEILKIDKVEILTNLSKEQIISKLDEINKEAMQFEQENDDPQVVNAVFIKWIGFYLHSTYHPFMDELEIDDRIFPKGFPLT